MQALRNLLARCDVIVVFFMFLLLFTFTSSFLFEVSVSNYKSTKEDLPIIELHNWRLYEIGKKSVNIDMKGAVAKRYANREVYQDFEMCRLSEDSIENLKGQEAIHKEDIYEFPKGVEYSNAPFIYFFSQAGTYNIVTEAFSGKGEFRIQDQQSITMGKDIFYDKKSDTIIAKHIHSQITRFAHKS
ncbi:hypothetical protein CQA66_06635 [Helicobacter aurati]|uniref:LPS export ABC transporter periplasmic protein LptC n=1 Tax=Helicobacter aurati TaxID=137778 RepID=A0A3D8J3C6_9HELI|nr:hypothetical protein [Helicobacter aurati]RDU71344.1 hypothetical protein CQA66_06635 [Helicobacter aurati]